MFETAVYMMTDVAVSEIIDCAMAAEAAGFDYFLVPDEGLNRDVFVALTAIALNTHRIRFGPAIVNPHTRHPVTSAVTVATLDEMSAGRAFIGYGIGGSLVLSPLGIEVSRPLRICREAIEITRGLFSGETVNYEGDFFRLNEAAIKFKVRKEIPIYFAARGNQMLALGGELADGVLLSGIARFDLQRSKDIILQGAAKTSRKPKLFYDVYIAFNDELLDRVRAEYTFMVVDSPDHIKQELGLSPERVEEIRSVMNNEGIQQAAGLITPELLSHFIIMGDDEACAREIVRTMEEFQFQVLTVPIPVVEKPARIVEHYGEIVHRAQEMTKK